LNHGNGVKKIDKHTDRHTHKLTYDNFDIDLGSEMPELTFVPICCGAAELLVLKHLILDFKIIKEMGGSLKRAKTLRFTVVAN